jgi:hypothetical protein
VIILGRQVPRPRAGIVDLLGVDAEVCCTCWSSSATARRPGCGR